MNDSLEIENSILNILPIGVGVADMDGNLLYFNDAMLVPGGYARGDIEKIGNVALLYFNAEAREEVLTLAKRQGFVDRYRIDFKKKDGKPYGTIMSLRMIKYRGNLAWLAIVEDVSEREKAEELNARHVKELEDSKIAMLNLLEDLDLEKGELTNEKKRDEVILSSIGSGLVITDEFGMIVNVNKGFETLTGFSKDSVLGKKMMRVLPKYDENDKLISEEDRSITKVLREGAKSVSVSSLSRTHYYLCNGGMRLYVVGTVTPIVIEDKVVGAVQIFRDVSEDMALDRAKDDFLSMASHELRTPLAAIDGIVSMMREGEYGELNQEMKSGLDDVNTASERLIKLVNDLLSISRMQAGRLKYTLSDFSVKELIDETVKFYEPVVEEKRLIIQTGEQIETVVHADIDKVRQILSNLLSNSLKFTEKGRITLSSSLKGDCVVIDIADTGCGIAIEDQEKLFGKFQQVGGEHSGTGLGLFIAHGMAKKMGGDLVLKSSQIGQGTVFSLILPVKGSSTAKTAERDILEEASLHSDQKSDIMEKK